MRWKIQEFSAAAATHLSTSLGVHSVVAGVLAARGITDPQQARDFLAPSLEAFWTEPEDIDGMSEVANCLEDAVRSNKRICIFGDFDVDGITASAIMANTLEALGSKASVVLPLRSSEGYGLSEAALERVYALEPEVLLTVDCGVSGAEEVEELKRRGIEVLITDHHEGSNEIPQGVPLADPKLDENSPQAILAGAGVALKLSAALGARFGEPDLWKESLDLATLGTVADCMPLTGENRALVAEGLKALNSKSRTGISVALETFGRNESNITTQTLSFGLIPRLNASGRVSDPAVSYDLVRAKDAARAQKLAIKLEELNKERKALEAYLYEQATLQIEAHQQQAKRVLVVGGENWHDGVKGIVAGKLSREYGVPALVFSFEGNLAIGSGRSVGTIDLHALVGKLSDMLLKFGGHKAAVGLTIEKERLSEFAARLQDEMLDVPAEAFESSECIDCLVCLELLSLQSVQELSSLEPFGEANPEPVFLSQDVLIKNARFVGGGTQHLSLVLSDGVREIEAIWFNTPYQELEQLPAVADVVYNAHIDEWRGRKKLKAQLLDLRSAKQEDASLDQNANEELGQEQDEIRQSQAFLQNLLLNGKREALQDYLAERICGQKVNLRKVQLKCLETLEEKKATLAIMATGRGKSLIFQTHAAKLAFLQSKPSLFIYPLRSLINDQEYALTKSFERLGLKVASLTGATPEDKRKEIERKVSEGSVAAVLTTPEFIFANAHKLSLWQDFAFVAVDEAHHIATSDASYRPDYTRLEKLKTLMPEATILATTATSDKEVTDAITQSLGIASIVVDTSKRPNLTMVDRRNCDNRLAELERIVDESSKALIYVSSRASSIELCKHLRKEKRDKAPRIAFYNAALTPEDRQKVETSFRSGELCAVIATSAFGEGINIPDIRDVVLYDLPYSLIDFNQMAGRAGRNGEEAWVHVLAQEQDALHMSESLQEGLKQTADGACNDSAEEKLTNEDTLSASEEGSKALQQLQQFANWLFKASSDGLSSVIQKPLTPLEEIETLD